MFSFNLRSSAFICGFFLLFAIGCGKSSDDTITIYTSVDEPVAEPILKAFEAKTGIKVIARYDTEASKSVGLAERLRAEKDHPECDVWWGNEIFLTINLATDGVLAPYDSPSAADVPAKFKDAGHLWTASGMRVRVLAVPAGNGVFMVVEGLAELANPQWKDLLVMARPVAGTTTGQVAALYTAWGDAKADAYFNALRANHIKLVGGNSIVAEAVGRGQFKAGLTDNDDVDAAASQGGNVRAVIPDQDSGLGTLAMPCTVAQVAGAKHAEASHKLIDYLLSKEVEQQLIAVKFVKYSVRASDSEIRTMDVDYAKVAAILPQATRRATAILDGREN